MVDDKQVILAIDPGTHKCGLAVVSGSQVLYQEVVDRKKLIEVIQDLLRKFRIDFILTGDRTGSEKFLQEIKEHLPQIVIKEIDEHRSSEEARQRYWQANPPQGWRKFVPTSFQVPPMPYDDYVAVILAERFYRNGTDKML